MLEGTWEEMVDNLEDNGHGILEKNTAGNETDSRFRRQAEIPKIPDQDTSK